MSFQPPRDRPVIRAVGRFSQSLNTVQEVLELKFWLVKVTSSGWWKWFGDHNYLLLDPDHPTMTIDGTPENWRTFKMWSWDKDGVPHYHIKIFS